MLMSDVAFNGSKREKDGTQKKIGNIGRPIWTHKVLGLISRGQTTRAEMQAFALQRHILAEGFIELLETIIRNTDNDSLKQCVKENLADETGHGVENDAHATWRAHYLLGLELSPPYDAPLLGGTKHYNQVLEALTNSRNPFQCAGALILLERSIPPEFARIRVGLEKVFPNTFQLQPGDSEAERARKMCARRYLVDHERHDARFHEPDLRRALIHPFEDGFAHDIILGAELLASAKVQFYDSIGEHLGW